MVEKTVPICDVCGKSIAKNKCPFCEKDLCSDCSEEIAAGTVDFKVCSVCLNKIENAGRRKKDFWKEFNKSTDMKNKIRIYLKKKMILDNLNDEGSDEDEGEGLYPPSRTKTRIIRRTKSIPGTWTEAMRKDGSV